MTERLGSHALRVATAALVLIALAGCGELPRVADLGEAVGGSEQDAAHLVERWFLEASSGAGDRGWSLLYPNTRTDVIGSAEVYRDAVDATDWAGVEYAIGDVWTHDGHFHVSVWVEGGKDQAPAFMLHWGLIQFPPTMGQLTNDGSMPVRIDPSGAPSGILGG